MQLQNNIKLDYLEYTAKKKKKKKKKKNENVIILVNTLYLLFV